MNKTTNKTLYQCCERQEGATVGRVVFGPAPGSEVACQQAVARLAVDSTAEIERLRARCERLEAALLDAVAAADAEARNREHIDVVGAVIPEAVIERARTVLAEK